MPSDDDKWIQSGDDGDLWAIVKAAENERARQCSWKFMKVAAKAWLSRVFVGRRGQEPVAA